MKVGLHGCEDFAIMAHTTGVACVPNVTRAILYHELKGRKKPWHWLRSIIAIYYRVCWLI